MVIVHYTPWLLFCQMYLLKGWFSRLKFENWRKILTNSNSDSPTHHGDSLTRRVEELATLRLAKFSFKHSKANSPTRQVGKSSTPRLVESESRRLPDSPSRGVANSPSASRFSITNISANSKPKSERLVK
jgi:hypothetical protein